MKQIVYIILVLIKIFVVNSIAYPIAIFHGFGQSCLDTRIVNFKKYLISRLSNKKIKCIEIGDGITSSIYVKLALQAQIACNIIKNDPDFKGKFTVIGFSMGGLIARSIVEQCTMPGKVVNYISVSTPQMGISKMNPTTCNTFCTKYMFNQNCASLCSIISNDKNDIIKTYQNKFAFTQFFRYRYSYTAYLQQNEFLRDLNNQKSINASYKSRIQALNRMVLIKNKLDTAIIPSNSPWFGYWDTLGKVEIPVQNMNFYKSDFLGIKSLNDKKKISFIQFGGDHLSITYSEIETYLIPILK